MFSGRGHLRSLQGGGTVKGGGGIIKGGSGVIKGRDGVIKVGGGVMKIGVGSSVQVIVIPDVKDNSEISQYLHILPCI